MSESSRVWILVSLALSAGAAGWVFGIERPANVRLTAEVAALRGALEEKERVLEKVRANAAKAPPGIQVTSLSPHSAIAPVPVPSAGDASASREIAPEETPGGGTTEDGPVIRPKTEWRMSIVKKFLPLTEEQSARLRKRLEDDSGRKRSIADLIEEEFGKEQADFYRAEVAKAFQRSEEESLEKDVYYLSRKLSLAPAQESQLFAAYREAGSLFNEEAPSGAETPVKTVVEREEKRRQFLNDRLRTFLSPEQVAALAALQADSSGQDLQTWHGE